MWSTKRHSDSSNCIWHCLICLSSLIYLSLKLLTWENSHLKSLLTFISMKGKQSAFKELHPRSSLVGLLLRCQGFKPLCHMCFWPRSAVIRCHYHLMAAKQPAQNELLVSVQFLVGRCPWRGREKKKHCHCNWYGLAPWLEALTASQKLNTLGCKGVEKTFFYSKGLQSSADALWQNKLEEALLGAACPVKEKRNLVAKTPTLFFF